MGTNYYAVPNMCDHCGVRAERIHIGKSSVGWRFLFHGYEELPYPFSGQIRSFQDWVTFLSGFNGEIQNEYRQSESLAKFSEFVQTKQEYRPHTDPSWIDEDGYDFVDYYFS